LKYRSLKKLRETSSAEQNFPDEITWITWKMQQNLKTWPFLKSDSQFLLRESGQSESPSCCRHSPAASKGFPYQSQLNKTIRVNSGGGLSAYNYDDEVVCGCFEQWLRSDSRWKVAGSGQMGQHSQDLAMHAYKSHTNWINWPSA